jgi:hypothetical protein
MRFPAHVPALAAPVRAGTVILPIAEALKTSSSFIEDAYV